MIQWIQVAGYAGDLQAAYDYFLERGGSVAAERFLMRYERSIATVIMQPASRVNAQP